MRPWTTSPRACDRLSVWRACQPPSGGISPIERSISPMSFGDRIGACNNYDPARVVPLIAAGERIGLLRRDNAAVLGRFSEVFAVGPDGVNLIATGDIATVSRAVDAVVDALVAERRVPKWRDETFDVAPRWGVPPVFRLDRGAGP